MYITHNISVQSQALSPLRVRNRCNCCGTSILLLSLKVLYPPGLVSPLCYSLAAFQNMQTSMVACLREECGVCSLTYSRFVQLLVFSFIKELSLSFSHTRTHKHRGLAISTTTISVILISNQTTSSSVGMVLLVNWETLDCVSLKSRASRMQWKEMPNTSLLN